MGKVCKEDSKVSISPHLFFLDECHHKSHIPGKFQSNWWMWTLPFHFLLHNSKYHTPHISLLIQEVRGEFPVNVSLFWEPIQGLHQVCLHRLVAFTSLSPLNPRNAKVASRLVLFKDLFQQASQKEVWCGILAPHWRALPFRWKLKAVEITLAFAYW